MAETYIVDCPGGERQAWQCPYCSRMYPTKDEEGMDTDCPANCRRCGAPMDIEKAHAFENNKAAESAGPAKRRETVKV